MERLFERADIRHAYPNKMQRRIFSQKVRECARKAYNIELVSGFAEAIKTTGVKCAKQRVASFIASLEGDELRAWYLHLSSKNSLAWKTEPVPTDMVNRDIVFIFAMGLGNGAAFPQPTGQFDLYCNDKLIISFRVVKHSQYWQSSEGSFYFSANRIESAAPNSSICLDNFLMNESFASFGIGFLRVPADRVFPGKQAVLKVVPVSKVESTRWFQLVATSGNKVIEQADMFSGLSALCNRTRATASGYNVYFGDIHTHSGVGYKTCGGCGTGTREENYNYAKGPGALDIYALTDHERQITKEGITDYFCLADDFNEDGRFVTIPGYEHTNPLYGHRNVYFRADKRTVIPAYRDWNTKTVTYIKPTELWAGLKACGADAITIPHHPSSTSHPLNWDFYNPHFDRLVEIYSVWGSSEYYGDYPRGVSDRFRGLFARDALNKGYRLGIIASADGHDGHPGNAQSPVIKHDFMFHPLGSGWIAVLAPKLTREDIFDAMYARRCYGTTGVPIVLDFTVNGQPMGSEISSPKQKQAIVLHITCHGTNGIDHVRIIKNGTVVQSIPCHGEWVCDIEWEDTTFDFNRDNYYYTRIVQVDGESAWSSPVWVG